MVRALFLVVLALMSVAQSQVSPRQWIRVTDNTSAADEVSLVRTADGILHVAWPGKGPSNKAEMKHATVTPDGRAQLEAPIIVNWNSLSKPALLAPQNGDLYLLFGGISGDSSPSSPFNAGSLYVATKASSSDRWSLSPDRQSASTTVYVGPVGAALDSRQAPVVTWAASDTLNAQLGLGATLPLRRLQAACCPYQPAAATDSQSGEVVIAWYSNASRAEGLFAQAVSPAEGAKQLAPGSVTIFNGSPTSQSIDQQIPITGRIGAPGVYLAYAQGYPTFNRVNLWRYGTETPVQIASGDRIRGVGISSAPEGRLWVMWGQGGRFYAVRSNRALTRFSPPQTITPPVGYQTTYRVKGEGSAGPLELFVHADAKEGTATYYTHVLPELTLEVTPKSVTGAQGGRLTISVTDVGDPVGGVAIEIGGRTLSTDTGGRAVYTIDRGARPQSLTITATAPGYARSAASVRIQ